MGPKPQCKYESVWVLHFSFNPFPTAVPIWEHLVIEAT